MGVRELVGSFPWGVSLSGQQTEQARPREGCSRARPTQAGGRDSTGRLMGRGGIGPQLSGTPSSSFLPPGTERQSCPRAHFPTPAQPAQTSRFVGGARIPTRGECTPPGGPPEASGDP